LDYSLSSDREVDMPEEMIPKPVPPGNVAVAAPASHGLPQAIREKRLHAARWILIAAGILWLGINGVLLLRVEQCVEGRVQSRVEEIRNQGKEAKRNSDEEIQWCAELRQHYFKVFGASAAVGVCLIVLGVGANFFPVLCTLGGLALCLGATAAYWHFVPDMQIESWLWRILSIAALIKAVHSAMTAPPEIKPAKRAAVFIPR
jgi:hypothetical protein